MAWHAGALSALPGAVPSPGWARMAAVSHAAHLTVVPDDPWAREISPPGPLPPPPHPEPGLAGTWPLQDFLELGALPGAVPCARLHARHVLWEWRLESLTESAELAVSELATNAIAASPAIGCVPPVRLWLLSDQVRLLILMWDGNEQPPLPASPDEDAEGGRGLMLVEAVCARWDWYPTPYLGGKAVWALCEQPPARWHP
jgi:anti-sigma regulatory factor (Ser/Thr protein kinase)